MGGGEGLDQPPYLCAGDDHEDLGDQVRRLAGARPNNVYRMRAFWRPSTPPRTEGTFVAVCSKGHKNAFHVPIPVPDQPR